MMIRRRSHACALLYTFMLLLLMGIVINMPRMEARRVGSRDEDDVEEVVEEFLCDGGRKHLAFKYVNDDYCDCADGSDESLTSACSHIPKFRPTFQCNKSVSGLPQMLLPSRIHDGICDCCDGSDELSGICKDDCNAAAIAYQEATMKEYKSILEGKKLRDEAVKQATSIVNGWKRELSGGSAHKDMLEKLELRLKVLQVKEEKMEGWEMFLWSREEEKRALLRQLEAEKRQWEKEQQQQDEGEKTADAEGGEGAKKPASQAKPSSPASNTQDTSVIFYDIGQGYGIEKVHGVSARLDGEDGGRNLTLQAYLAMDDLILSGQKKETVKANKSLEPDALGRLLLELFGVAIFGGLKGSWWGVRFSIGGWMELIGLKGNWDYLVDEEQGLLSDLWNEMMELIENALGGHVDGALSILKTMWMGPDMLYTFFFPHQSIKGYERLEAALLRKALEILREELDGFKDRMKEVKDKIQSYLYGQDYVYVTWKDKCFEKKDKEFTYKVCPFNDVKQNFVLIGRWSRWGGRQSAGGGSATGSSSSSSSSSSMMLYDRGSKCWNGPERSAQITLECASTEEIIEISEPSICVYDMIMTTPLACDDALLKKVEKKLEALGVESAAGSASGASLKTSASASSSSREEL